MSINSNLNAPQKPFALFALSLDIKMGRITKTEREKLLTKQNQMNQKSFFDLINKKEFESSVLPKSIHKYNLKEEIEGKL